jgi:hypothetical protein
VARHLSNLIVEILFDGDSWMELYRRENKTELQRKYMIGTFDIAERVECRFLNHSPISLNHLKSVGLTLAGSEIHGFIHEQNNS